MANSFRNQKYGRLHSFQCALHRLTMQIKASNSMSTQDFDWNSKEVLKKNAFLTIIVVLNLEDVPRIQQHYLSILGLKWRFFLQTSSIVSMCDLNKLRPVNGNALDL